MRPVVLWIVTVSALLAGATALAGEPDWFTRVKEQGLEAACRVEVERHGKGILADSLHVGSCYYQLGRHGEGVAVFGRLARSPDRNYAAAAAARFGEGLYHLGRREEARATFLACIEEHPEAWLDGSIPDLCRAWIDKIDGRLASPDVPAPKAEPGEVEKVRKEIEELSERLRELRELLEELRKKE